MKDMLYSGKSFPEQRQRNQTNTDNHEKKTENISSHPTILHTCKYLWTVPTYTVNCKTPDSRDESNIGLRYTAECQLMSVSCQWHELW